MITKEDALKALDPIEQKFLTEVQKQAILRLNVAVKQFAYDLYENTPESALRTLAGNKLLELKMLATQAITHVGFSKEERKDAKGKSGNWFNKD